MASQKNVEFNKLRFKWRELNKELSNVNEIEQKSFSLFYESLMKEVNKFGLESPFDKEDEEIRQKNEIFDTQETKKIYRDIAIKSHPDRNCGRENIFKELVDSKKNNSINKLFDSAKKVELKIEEITFEHIEKMEEEINEIEKKINKKINSIHWGWMHSDKKQRELIIKNIINNLKYEQKKE